MKIVVDPTMDRNEIRVPDADLAEWLAKDGEAFHKRVEEEAELFLRSLP